MKTVNLLASLMVAIVSGCSDASQIKELRDRLSALEARASSQNETDLAKRLQALEKQINQFSKEIRTTHIYASSAEFSHGGSDSKGKTKTNINAYGITIIDGDEEKKQGTVAKLSSDRLYIEDLVAFSASNYWEEGLGIDLSLKQWGNDSPELRVWHKDAVLGKAIDKLFVNSGAADTQVTFNLGEIGKADGFYLINNQYGLVILQLVELKKISSESALSIKIAVSSAIPLSGLKGKVTYRLKGAEGPDKGAKTTPFLLDKRLDSGVYYPISIPIGASKEDLLPNITLFDIEVIGLLLRNTP